MPTNTSISSTFVLSSLLSSVTSWARPPKGVSLSRNLSRVSGAIVVVLMVSTMLISSVQARVVPQYLRSVPESSYKIHHHKHHNHQQRHHQYGSSQAQKLTSLGRSGIWVNLAIPANTEIPKPPPPPPTTTLPPMAPTTSTQQPDLSRLLFHSAQTTMGPVPMESHIDSDHNENDEEDEEERQALLDLEEHLRRKLHRQARQAPNLCIKDETGKSEAICQTCSEMTNNPGGHHDCCRNIESAFSWCKRLYDFRSRFGG